jgi:hypothetical protein
MLTHDEAAKRMNVLELAGLLTWYAHTHRA